MRSGQLSFARYAGRFGRVLALVLVLAGQLAAGALAMPSGAAASPEAQLMAAMVVCDGGAHPVKGGKPPIHHHLPDLALASHVHHFVQQAALLDHGAAVPSRASRAACWAVVPEARGPPARYACATYPTGPPASLI